MSIVWSSVTHLGRVRSVNQDRAHPTSGGRNDGPQLLVVADGMGGHVGGEIAASVAIEAALESEGTLEERVRQANRAIVEEVEEKPELTGMGTTMTMAEVGTDRRLRLAHVGDSRAYLLRSGVLVQLTTDHTLVAEYVAQGRLRADQASSHPQRSLLTRALGLETHLLVDTAEFQLKEGDRLLLCSDGLNSMLSDREITDLLDGDSTEEAAWRLVEAANLAGGHDNVTVVVADVR
ncbi:MAG TPA: Stp1/IreP family PP2C-type Ser/Thr phosphatase [Acidimicrobiia bacterium]|nr:Stp1/IreP family PP2C-type Ser/Thr phosphatase [Acidimicrobiia bacterium]